MMYEVNEKGKKIKQIIIYVIILLSVLCCSIFAGVKVAQLYKVGETKNKSSEIIKQGKNQVKINRNISNNDNAENTQVECNELKENSAENIILNVVENTATVTNEIKNEYTNNTIDSNSNDTNTSTSNTKDYSNFVKKVDNIYNGEEGKRVFLTFDDGPSKSVTPHILDLLKFHNIKATFFVLGSRVKLNPDIVKREYDEGHYIANHGYSHKYSSIYAKPENVIEEYNKTEAEIRKALNNQNYSSHLFRFPGGSIGGEYNKIKKSAKKQLKEKQIAYLDWNALTSDAAGANTKEKILKNMKKTVGNYQNVVLLMHDAPDKKLTYETLEDVITYLTEKGYSFKNFNNI